MTLQAIDFTSLLDSEDLLKAFPRSFGVKTGPYKLGEGIQISSESVRFHQEIVRLTEDVILFTNKQNMIESGAHRQIIGKSDWLHFQFRISGEANESINGGAPVHLPPRSCFIGRYAAGTSIDRTSFPSETSSTACLMIRPGALSNLLEVDKDEVLESHAWLFSDSARRDVPLLMPLTSAMSLAIRDLVSCSISGRNRRIYLRAKSTELLAILLDRLISEAQDKAPQVQLSARDVEKLGLAKTIIEAEVYSQMTLADLACRVGLNRTKLAVGFKATFGSSVQLFWRDLKMDIAKQMLEVERRRVTDVALDLGYADVSSFSRAFQKKFAVPPSATQGRRLLSKINGD